MTTNLVIVTLARMTPVQEAAHLHEDLRRADIEPYVWVIDRSPRGRRTPQTRSCARGQRSSMQAVKELHAKRVFVPWSADEPAGAEALHWLMKPDSSSSRLQTGVAFERPQLNE